MNTEVQNTSLCLNATPLPKPLVIRRDNGRFLPGCAPGPGRPRGTPSEPQLTGKLVKAAFLDSFKRNNGPQLLDRLARENPLEYLKLIAKVLPREFEAEVRSPHLDERVLVPARERFGGEI